MLLLVSDVFLPIHSLILRVSSSCKLCDDIIEGMVNLIALLLLCGLDVLSDSCSVPLGYSLCSAGGSLA